MLIHSSKVLPANYGLSVDYLADGLVGLDNKTLAVLGFGGGCVFEGAVDSRQIGIGLQSSFPGGREVWRSSQLVSRGQASGVYWACDGVMQWGWVLVADAGGDDIVRASRLAYQQLKAHLQESGYRYLLRSWNYMDAITQGEGDKERYRQFCVGRVAGLGQADVLQMPAATAIGHKHQCGYLQVFWLASCYPGRALENSRQVSAYRYPRRYGVQSPSFARAMLPPVGVQMPLMLSGTASILGHVSMHVDCVRRQLDEIFTNLEHLIVTARQHEASLPEKLGASSRLKVYVNDVRELPAVAEYLEQRLGAGVPYMLLHGEVCRRDLRVEIEGLHG